MELPQFDQPQAPDTVEKIVTGIQKSCQQQRRFSSCKHLSLVCELFSFSTVKVRVQAPLTITACLFLSLQFLLITVELLFSNMHPSITIYYNSPIHAFLCIIPSGGFTYCAYPHAPGAVITSYHRTLSKDNNQQFSVGMDDMLETDKAFTSNILQLFINVCKLQLRDHTYTMIHFSQNQFSSHLQISRGTPVFDRFGIAALVVWHSICHIRSQNNIVRMSHP